MVHERRASSSRHASRSRDFDGCRQALGGGSGSLLIALSITGTAHYEANADDIKPLRSATWTPRSFTPGSLPAPRTAAVLVQSVWWSVVFIVAPFLLLLFPQGQPPSQHWRLLAWSIVAADEKRWYKGHFGPRSSVLKTWKSLR